MKERIVARVGRLGLRGFAPQVRRPTRRSPNFTGPIVNAAARRGSPAGPGASNIFSPEEYPPPESS